MIRTLYVGDVHLSDTPPGWRTDTYREDVLAKLNWCAEAATKAEVDALIFGGDMFHHRRRSSFGLVVEAMSALEAYAGRIFIVPGNHDMLEDRLNSAFTETALAVLHQHPQIELLAHVNVPLRSEGFTLNLCGVPYEHQMPYERVSEISPPSSGERNMLVVHYGVTPEPVPFHTLVTSDERWQANGTVFAAHIHDYYGKWEVNGNSILNPGALSRGSISEAKIDRVPLVVLSDWSGAYEEHKFVRVPHKATADAFRMDDYHAKKDGERISEDFLESLTSVRLQSFSIEALMKRISDDPNLEPPVKERALQAIHQVWD